MPSLGYVHMFIKQNGDWNRDKIHIYFIGCLYTIVL